MCGATEGSAEGHTYDSDTDLDCDVCGYVRGYWSEWTDGGTAQISETGTRQVETRTVTVTVTQYRYSRSVWYNSNGVYSSSRRPPNEYTLGTPEAGSKTYRWDYTPWLDSAISPVYVESWGIDKYEYNGTAYYTEETQDVNTTETHWFYRNVKYY